MTFTIPDDILKTAGLTEGEALIEFACRLFDAGRLDKPTAARLAGLDRVTFEAELRSRGIAIWRPTDEDLVRDAETIRKLDGHEAGGQRHVSDWAGKDRC